MSPVRLFAHVALVVLLPPLLLGVIARTKALFAGRVGPPLVQPYRDLLKLAQKSIVLGTPTTLLFVAGPVVGVVTALLAALLVPLGATSSPLSFAGDLVLFAYLLSLGRFFALLAALDTGSSFEGMGAAREALFSCLVEPALFLGMLVLARLSSSLSLATMLGPSLGTSWAAAPAVLVLVALSLSIVVLAETSRIPVDDPNTHLELTMVHEVMVLDHGGPLLALVEYSAAVKLFVLGSLLVRLVLPLDAGSFAANLLVSGAGLLVLAVGIGVIESTMARMRLTHVPSLLLAASLMSGFGLVLAMR